MIGLWSRRFCSAVGRKSIILPSAAAFLMPTQWLSSMGSIDSNSTAGNQCNSSLPPILNGIKEGTFVTYTIAERWPKTLAKAVDHVHCKRREFMEQYGPEADADVKSVIHELSELRYRIMTDKPLEDLTDTAYHYDMWNKLLADLRKEYGEEQVTWYRMSWLFTECFLYRKVVGAVAKTKYLKEFDIYREQKVEAFNDHLQETKDGLDYVFSVAKDLNEQQERETLETLLKMSLWGNTCDLSLSSGDSSQMKQSPIEAARQSDHKILCNDLKVAIDSFLLKLKPNKNGSRELHIVLDNAGPELMVDLMLGEYLMETKLVDKTVLHGKEYPYFVSDCTAGDFKWTLEELNKLGGVYQEMYRKLSERVNKNELVYEDHPFWSYPHPYCEMKFKAPDLYERLSEASLIIFKGDLNYRKLLADREWPYETPFKTALNGFLPAPVLALRSLKAELVAGLSHDVSEKMKAEPDKKWLSSGEYGVAELAF